MTEAVLDLDEHTNYVLNIIKERYNLKDISEANNLMALQYEEKILEPECVPISELEFSDEFIAETLENMKEKPIGHFKNADELKAHIKGCR